MNERTAKVLRVELVSGDMLTVTTDADGSFDFESVNGYLNGSAGRFNTWDTALDVRPGDEITEGGEIIEGEFRGRVDEVTLRDRTIARWDEKLDR